MALEPVPLKVLFPWQCLLDSGWQNSQQGTGEGLVGHQARQGWGLRKPGFSEVETGPKWTGRSWLVFPWQRSQPGSQKARNLGATDSVGLASQGC